MDKKERENSLQTDRIERAAVYRQQPPAEKLQANVAQSEGLKKRCCSIAVDPHGSLRFQNFCGRERSSFSYGYRRSSSINARYMAWNIGLTVTASKGVCFCVFFLVPGRPALGANKQLNPIDCSNAASAPSATRRRGREKQHSTPESKQVILNDPHHL